MRIVLLGAPGAGKGTQCKRIIDKYGLVHLSSGDILRKERAEGTELGKKAESYRNSGALVPDELIVEMMAGAISKAPSTGFVLDGFPRTVNQARQLDKSLAIIGQKIDAVLNLKVQDRVVTERITGRRSCLQCGAVYHIENLRPKTDGICDDDGAELIQRPDDSFEVVANRMKSYHRQTEPVVDYYKTNSSAGAFYELDADKDADQVSVVVFEKLDTVAKC